MAKSSWKPARSIKKCDEILTGPGQLYELEHAIIDGAVYRVYKNLWPSVREYWLETVSNNRDLHARDYIIFEDFRLTYGQTDELVQRAASVFRDVYGVKKGDRIGIGMRNFPEGVISFLASGLLGAVPTMFNAWLPIEPFLHCIKLTSPKLLIVDMERLKLLGSYLYPLDPSVIVVRPTTRDYGANQRVKEWSEVLSSYSGSLKAWEKEPNPLPEDDALILFTSGTTGYPKGVLSRQRAFLENIFNSTYARRRRELRLGRDSSPSTPPTTLTILPFFHIAACNLIIGGPAMGNKLIFMHKWDKDQAAGIIVSEKITSVMVVPTIAYDLLETNLAGNAIETIVTGGAPTPDSLPTELSQKFPAALLGNIYGLTETCSSGAFVVGEDYLERPGCAGLPPPTVDLLVVDPHTNAVLPRGQIGELWIRGPCIMRGYVDNPQATAKAVTRDGWFKSGDLASIDDEGFVYIKDRLKDMIIRGGENIHCTVVESALFADERVLDCAAVGIPHKRLGELVGAVVVPRQEWRDKLTEKDILQKVKRRLPAFAVPSIIIVQNETLERNPVGKTIKQGLRTMVANEWERRRTKGKL